MFCGGPTTGNKRELCSLKSLDRCEPWHGTMAEKEQKIKLLETGKACPHTCFRDAHIRKQTGMYLPHSKPYIGLVGSVVGWGRKRSCEVQTTKLRKPTQKHFPTDVVRTFYQIILNFEDNRSVFHLGGHKLLRVRHLHDLVHRHRKHAERHRPRRLARTPRNSHQPPQLPRSSDPAHCSMRVC